MNLFSKEDFLFNVKNTLRSDYAVSLEDAENYEIYNALSKVIMRTLSQYWESDAEKTTTRNAYYLSSEYLMGRALSNNLVNLDILKEVKEVVQAIGLDFNTIENVEQDAGLGNGGLGRLAACFLDSAATHGLPLHGYGIRYEYGIFKQAFEGGAQVEKADTWLQYGDPWSIRRASDKKVITFSDQQVYAVPYDTPIVGYKSAVINTLRLWRSEPIEEFNFELFNAQDYDEAMKEKNRAEDISRVLYPNDSRIEGKILRLKQQYFFVSASIQDLVEKHKKKYKSLANFYERNTLQLNDTHPAVAVAELIRILIDEEGYDFSDALKISQKTFNYTNHTILSEALEKWDANLYREKLPRVYEIIEMIDGALQNELTKKGVLKDDQKSYLILSDNLIHMANLSIYGSRYVNGVAAIHTEILKEDTLHQWYRLYPDKFQNKTNGITQRRWCKLANPELSALFTEYLGSDDWVKELTELEKLETEAEDEAFISRFMEIKAKKKEELRDYVLEHEGIEINPNSLYDIQIKRLHEYKRQLLNAFYILDTYYKIKDGKLEHMVPRTHFFGAKAAPGYVRAKAIIKFINAIADKVNNDPMVKDKMKVVFVENYNVTYAEKLIPAADLSEQISTAGKEASGTGNMKFMLNGAPTIGTMDGANVEIVQEAGKENNFIFGLSVEEVKELRPHYNPKEYYEKVEGLKRVVDSLIDNTFPEYQDDSFKDLHYSLLEGNDWDKADQYLLLADFESYREAQEKVSEAFKDPKNYARMSIQNMIHAGFFSSDRTIKQYAEEIWNIKPLGR